MEHEFVSTTHLPRGSTVRMIREQRNDSKKKRKKMQGNGKLDEFEIDSPRERRNLVMMKKQTTPNNETKKPIALRDSEASHYITRPMSSSLRGATRSPRSYSLPSSRRLSTLLLCTILITLNLLLDNGFNVGQQLKLPQQVAASTTIGSINGLQQSMAQLLQVFNGNETQAPELRNFKLMEVYGDFLLLGARNVVYNVSLTSMREVRRIEWPSSEEDTRMCRLKGKSIDQCQNYIRVAKLMGPNTLYICGTNSYKPRCRSYIISENAYELADESPGEGACPYQESQNVTSLFADGHLYSAFAAQFSGFDGLIHRTPLRTEQFNPKQLNSPNFVSSFRYGEHVYFLFRESAIEHINCGKTIYSRIARVCINDSGGQTRANGERWTSFTKARLNCSIPGEYPFYFDQIQASTGVISSATSVNSNFNVGNGEPSAASNTNNPANDLFYAVFTTPPNSIGGSAVCAFRMSDVLAAFEGPFKAQADGNANWLPVPESKVPQPRPGTCVNDSKRLPDEHINFIKDNPLMDQPVEALWSQPLIMMASINFRFTQIAVDPQVETQFALGAPLMRSDMIFVGTDDGRAFKLMNTHHLVARATGGPNGQAGQQFGQHNYPATQSVPTSPTGPYSAPLISRGSSHTLGAHPQSLAFSMNPSQQAIAPLVDISSSTVVIEELHLFDARTPIVNMLIYHHPPNALYPQQRQQASSGTAKLLVLSGKQLKAIPLSRCERALTCADCLALFDPYCAWDTRQQACIATGRSMAPQAQTSDPDYYQVPSLTPWFTANNHTIAWWSQCPVTSDQPSGQQQLASVGAPFRSLFSSHLQVPSRFDYASGHHLAQSTMVTLTNPNSIAARQQPASECLTFCGGLYTPQSQIQPNGDLVSQAGSSCADFVQQHYLASSGLNGPSQQSHSLYTSENLYIAVIICSICGIILGLLSGFALGRNTKKHDSSICSSTFDETNLYMASTGSHTARNLFAPHHQSLLQHHPLIQQQQQLLSNGGSNMNGYHRQTANGLFDTNQGMSGDHVYGNAQQQQLLLALTSNGSDSNSLGPGSKSSHSNPNSSSTNNLGTVRCGALPPIPTDQIPLVSNSNALINHSSLAPNNLAKGQQNSGTNGNHHHATMSMSSGSSSTNTSSTSTTAPASDHHNQFYLNQQQILFQQQQPQHQNKQVGCNRIGVGQQDSLKTKSQALQQQQQTQPQQNKFFL